MFQSSSCYFGLGCHISIISSGLGLSLGLLNLVLFTSLETTGGGYKTELETCIDDERQKSTAKRPQVPSDATVRKRFSAITSLFVDRKE